MKKIYYIRTGNECDEILVFPTKESAVAWAQRATRWTADDIEKNINISVLRFGGCFPIFPKKFE